MKQQYQSIIQGKVSMRLKVARDLRVSGNYQKAIQEYIRALFLDRNNGDAYRELAEIYLDIGDLSPAISLYSRALAVSFDIALEDKLQSVILMKGRMLMEQGDWNNFLEGGEFEQFGSYLQFYQTEILQLRKTERNSPFDYHHQQKNHSWNIFLKRMLSGSLTTSSTPYTKSKKHSKSTPIVFRPSSCEGKSSGHLTRSLKATSITGERTPSTQLTLKCRSS